MNSFTTPGIRTPLRVIVVEDHPVVRNGIRMLIESQPDMTVVAEADDGKPVIELLNAGMRAEIIISDLNMPHMDGYALFEHIKNSGLPINIIVLSMLDTQQHVERAFQAGCLGYLTKAVEPAELIFALRQVATGKKYICSATVNQIVSSRSFQVYPEVGLKKLPELSDRELEVLKLIAQGMTTIEIADQIFLSKRTVEGHRQSLMDKTGSRNAAVLVKLAAFHGLVQ